MSTLTKISCPKCGAMIDLRTDVGLPDRDAEIARLREALEKIADLGQEHSGGAVTDYENIAREALAAAPAKKSC